MVAKFEVQVGIHHFSDARLHIVAADIAPCHGHLRSTDYIGEAFVFVAKGFGNDECDVHIAALPHASCEAVAGSAQASQDMRGETPNRTLMLSL